MWKIEIQGGTSTRKRTNSTAGLTATVAGAMMFAITSPATLVGAPTACFKVRDPFLVDDLPFRGRANPDPPDRRARKKI